MKYLFGIMGVGALALGGWFFMGNEEFSESPANLVGKESVVEKDELENYEVAVIDYVDAKTLISASEVASLSQTEMDGLVFMREEEKLARDVYLTLYDTWGVSIFSNIADSEFTHMNAVLTLLEHYGIADPANSERGVFSNPDLQTLYDELVAYGGESIIDAFTVGAKIEDLDIRDLEVNKSNTSNSNILAVYESLQRGSRNHLRAFNRQIFNETGENYTPEFISNDVFSTIISARIESGAGIGQGNASLQKNMGENGRGNGNGKN